jgi:hypothetical protein
MIMTGQDRRNRKEKNVPVLPSAPKYRTKLPGVNEIAGCANPYETYITTIINSKKK